jgi:hypothetical protein
MKWLRTQQRRFGKLGISRSMQIMKRSPLDPIPTLSGRTLRVSFGARRHVSALLSGLLSQSKFGSLLRNARLGTWEPAHSHPATQSPRVGAPASRSRFANGRPGQSGNSNTGDSPCIRIALRSSVSLAATPLPGPLTTAPSPRSVSLRGPATRTRRPANT